MAGCPDGQEKGEHRMSIPDPSYRLPFPGASARITFDTLGVLPGQKTNRWEVSTLDGKHSLGVIAWFGRWRKYAFFPTAPSTFEEICLRDIANFIEYKTREYRNERANSRP
jgi:hypothetical protein